MLAGLPSLTLRPYRDDSDYSLAVALINTCYRADGIDEVESVEHLTNSYASLEEFDPHRDLLFAEAGEKLVGYAQIEWATDVENVQYYMHIVYVHPDRRGMGLGETLLAQNERQLQEIAATHPAGQRSFEVMIGDTETELKQTLLKMGYQPGRYFYKMKCNLADDIPSAPLPLGVDIRTAQPEHYRAIWDANDEAFHDHWSHMPGTESDYQAWLKRTFFDPTLWQIAWDGDQVAGMSINQIDADENAVLGCLRGEVQSLCVRRPWRGNGLARVLLAQSLHTFKIRGMTEAFLYVDTENTSGALRLYESLGFEVTKRFIAYHKPLW